MTVATTFGPRVTAFRFVRGDNVFAELGDLSISLPDGRNYRLVGGHRLWVAPEIPEITYEPDDAPVAVSEEGSRLRIDQAASPATGIAKSLTLQFVDGRVEVMHSISNRGRAPIRIAPWAITQFPVGGTALLPVPVTPTDKHGLQPNAEIVLWPYTGIGDTPFLLHDRTMIIPSDRTEAAKVGTTLDRGWLAYVRDGLVFVKRARQIPEAEYLDRGAAAQCYCSADFVELETLAPVAALEPGAGVEHTESWELYEVDPNVEPPQIPEILGLDRSEL
ncbi:MAG: DUF4380 domain-containing protein [Acidimicrobiia bacterium]|nr:DUF4380 domain-containing protein [Acidimicrobiia bacterium]